MRHSDTQEKVDKVNALRKEGKSAEQAVKEVGIPISTYYNFKRSSGPAPKRAYRKRKPKIEVQVLEQPHVVSIYGMLDNGSLVKLSDLLGAA